MNKANPKSISQIVEYLKKIDDDLFYAPTRLASVQESDLRSVSAEKKEPDVTIYPNPVGHTLNIDSKTNNKIESVEIFTLTGFRALNIKGLDIHNSLDVARLSQGVHIVVVESGGERFTFRIMKQ